MTPSARLVGVGVFVITGLALFTVALFLGGLVLLPHRPRHPASKSKELRGPIYRIEL